jgi:hypothetical protein
LLSIMPFGCHRSSKLEYRRGSVTIAWRME